MKNLFLGLIVLAGAGYLAWHFYFKDHPINWVLGPEDQAKAAQKDNAKTSQNNSAKAATTPSMHDFKDVSRLLQGDMDRIPSTLHEARQIPVHALDVRAKVAPFVQMHAEYLTLEQVCDMIIGADQDFAERQGKCGFATSSEVAARDRTRPAGGPSAALVQQQEALWNAHRRQADTDVRVKLESIESHQL